MKKLMKATIILLAVAIAVFAVDVALVMLGVEHFRTVRMIEIVTIGAGAGLAFYKKGSELT
jgi:hypothetical protein